MALRHPSQACRNVRRECCLAVLAGRRISVADYRCSFLVAHAAVDDPSRVPPTLLMEAEHCRGIAVKRHGYSIAGPLSHCILPSQVLYLVRHIFPQPEKCTTYVKAASTLPESRPHVRQPLSRIVSIATQCPPAPDDDAPDALQASQSLRKVCSNDQHVLKAAYYGRHGFARAWW